MTLDGSTKKNVIGKYINLKHVLHHVKLQGPNSIEYGF